MVINAFKCSYSNSEGCLFPKNKNKSVPYIPENLKWKCILNLQKI